MPNVLQSKNIYTIRIVNFMDDLKLLTKRI